MHTLQIMLVEADDEIDVEDKVESNRPDWSDWHEVGGRWGGYFDGANIIRYADNITLAEDTIKTALQWRAEEIERLREDIDFETVETLIDSYDLNNSVFDHSVWQTKRLLEMVMNYWTPDSKVFDLEDYSAGLSAFRSRVAENPESQYLVAVDYHF